MIESNTPLNKNGEIKKNNTIPDIKNKKNNTDRDTGTSVSENAAIYSETTASVQREIIKEQLVLAGLNAVSSYMQSGTGKEENSAFLSEIIEKTRFDNEKVLEGFYQPLGIAIDNNDLQAIESLVRRAEEQITSYVTDLEINEIKKQNLLSMQSLSGEENTEERMQKILTALKEEGLPKMNIPLQRITDLLGE